MKYRNTKERIRDRNEFVYKYRQEIKELLNVDLKDDRIVKFVKVIVRNEIPYSPVTYYVDIWFMIKRAYRLLKENNIL